MADIRFYHLRTANLERALPQLLEKTLERGLRSVVMLGSEERVEALVNHLWTYRDRGFLPHGSDQDGQAAEQPVWLTTRDENPNGAQVLFLADGAISEHMADFEICALLFDGHDETAVGQARDLWRQLKEAEQPVTYWQQTDSGGWEKKA